MIRTLAGIGAFILLASAQGLLGQTTGLIDPQHVPPSMMYHRVWAVTPLVGTGAPGDPKRPMFVPAPTQSGPPATPAIASAPPKAPSDRTGILGFQMQLSDDRQSALVEFVFASPTAFQAVLQQEAAVRGIPVPAAAPPVAPPAVTAPAKSVSVSASLAAPSTAQTALESAVPGLKMFERGKATDADILTEFQKHKAGFTFGSATVRPK